MIRGSSMKKINSISPEQWAEIPKIRKKLIDNQSQPIDEDKARYWICELYKSAKLSPPRMVFFFDSPLSMHLAAVTMKSQLGAQLWAQLRAQLWAQLRAQLWAQLETQLRYQLGDQLGDQLRYQLGDQLRSQLWAQLGTQLRSQLRSQLADQLWAQLGDQLRSQLGSQLADQLGGQVDTQWASAHLGWFQGGLIAGVKFQKANFNLYSGYVKNVNTILPFEEICFASRRPVEIHWQDEVLHSEVGPSVLYADGFAVYSIEGVKVDKQIVEDPHTQTLKQLVSEKNEEKKRIRISRYGWHKFLEEMNAKVVDVSTPVHWMESLMQCGDMKVLCTYDPSTGRPYALEVDESCETCEQAQRYLLAPEIALEGLGISASVKTYPILRT